MKELISFLLQFGDLNPQQIELIGSKSTKLELKKDVYFIESGNMFKQVAFILEGIFRICYYNHKGEEITKYFLDENHFLLNPYKGEPMTEYIQAVTDCKLLVFYEKDWDELSQTIINWDSIISKIFQKALVEKLDRRSSLVTEDATTRCLTFLEKFPNMVNQVPLSYVASYLGITQQSLSRIRKNIH